MRSSTIIYQFIMMNLKFIVAVFATTLITGGLSYRRKSMGYTRFRLPSATNSDKLTGRVVNGHDVYPGEIPYQLFLQITRSTVSRKGKICGAALVETYGVQFALTAAHCVHLGYPTPFSAVSPKNVRITAGAHDIKHSSGNEQVRIATKVVLHEQYDKYDDKTLHDIAILFYANPFKYNDYVKTIQLPEYMWKLPERVEISGWGSTTAEPNFTFPNLLKAVEMKTISIERCKKYEFHGNEITWRQMCLRDTTGIGACSGDSGGPAGGTNSTNGDWYLAGILSYSIGNCGSRYPVVYMRVSAYIDWIRIQVNDYLNQ